MARPRHFPEHRTSIGLEAFVVLAAENPSPVLASEVSDPLVLVVDDSPLDRRLAGGLLRQKANVRVTYAQNGLEALEVMRREQPVLLVTDLQMPEMDGLELVEAVRAEFPLVPTILMTAHGSEELTLQALRRGAASYVPKRNLGQDLVSTVRDVLALSRSRMQQQRLQQCWTQTEFRFCLENDSSLIPLLVVHLQQYLQSVHHCDETELVRVGVALHEALRNAMHHGNLELDSALRRECPDEYYQLAEQRRQAAPYCDRRVHVVARESRTEACYVIQDEGTGFVPDEVPDPTDPHLLERHGGRGLFLIRTFMHDVRFNELGNQITLIHRRDAPE